MKKNLLGDIFGQEIAGKSLKLSRHISIFQAISLNGKNYCVFIVKGHNHIGMIDEMSGYRGECIKLRLLNPATNNIYMIAKPTQIKRLRNSF